MTTLVREASQAGWLEEDEHGQPVLCATNSARIVNQRSVWLLEESQDRSEWTECAARFDVSLAMEPRERPEIDEFEHEYAGFQSLLPSLRAKHPGRFVAVHGGVAVDSDKRRDELVRRFFTEFGDVPVYIGYVGEPPVAYQLTPFRL